MVMCSKGGCQEAMNTLAGTPRSHVGRGGEQGKALEEMMLILGLEAVDGDQPWAGPGSVKHFPSRKAGMCKGPVAGRHCSVWEGD